MKMIRLALGLAIACASAQSLAQYALEIIPLRHSTVEQVLPALRPLLEAGGTLTGQQGQLFLRASPANVADIRRALEAIDRPLRRLQISVRFDDAREASKEAIEASGRISNRGSEIEVRARNSRGSLDERVDQRVQVVEGGRAFITTGQSRPAVQRQRIQTPGGVIAQETFVMQDASTGFEVAPRLSGDRVFLDIAPQRESFTDSGTVQGQRVSSTASARLGEWFELGGITSSGMRDDRGIASASGSRSADSRRVWVKVEEIRN
jgi:type II secretory pathway component GspD/PulD (secretin)